MNSELTHVSELGDTLSLDTAIFDILDTVCEKTADEWAEISPIIKTRGIEYDLENLNGFLRVRFGPLSLEVTRTITDLSRIINPDNYLNSFKELMVPIMVECNKSP